MLIGIALLPLGAAAVSAAPSWASLPLRVPEKLPDHGRIEQYVQLNMGTPPQAVELAVNPGVGLFTAWSFNCPFCPGDARFQPSRSSSFQTTDQPWAGNIPAVDNGYWNSETVSIGGILTQKDIDFVLMEQLSLESELRIPNGVFGLAVNATNTHPHIFTSLYKSGALLNPVIGLRSDTTRPRLTVGALDPEDYEGEINWVEVIRTPGTNYPTFKIDGFKGFNGKFIGPSVSEYVASVDAFLRSIYLPPGLGYFESEDHTGPLGTPEKAELPNSEYYYACDITAGNIPTISLTVTINGVDYPLDSLNNMLREPQSVKGYCAVAIRNNTLSEIDASLGLPFLRSVYLAYRFPTDDCPGYLGFAFPSGLNRTQEQTSQRPTSTPPQASQCLALKTPSSTPLITIATRGGWRDSGEGKYNVYGAEGNMQVPLLDADQLEATVWDPVA